MTPVPPTPSQGRILVVDDDRLVLKMLAAHLEESSFRTELAGGGAEAWQRLREDGPPIDAVLLDWNMPELSGIELLRRIKAEPDLRMLPVILQSARNDPRDLAEGIEAGAYYYLEKPIHPEMLRRVVEAALRDHKRYLDLQRTVEENQGLLDALRSALFEIRTVAEARALAATLSRTCPEPDQTVVGLGELIVNAVEHGNLGITYEEKTELLAAGRWEEEVARRLARPEHRDKRVRVELERRPDVLRFRVEDEGAGFDWEQYLEICPARLLHSHGRGIALARALCFSDLEYRGRGNEVVATVRRASTGD